MATAKNIFPFKYAPNYKSYATVSTFGSYAQPVTNAVLWSTVQDYSTSFTIGPTSLNYGPDSAISQAFIADYISLKPWDSNCEVWTTNPKPVKVNAASILPVTPDTSLSMTIGECNTYNAACRSFVDLADFNVSEQRFNPDDSHSPMIRMYSLIPYRSVKMYVPPDPNNNILLNIMLDAPDRYLDLLLNLYANKSSKNVEGTRIGKLFDKISLYYQQKYSR